MNGIENIIERIEQDLGAQIAAVEQQAAQEAAQITAKYEQQAAQEWEQALERGRAAAAERKQRLKGVAELEAKKQALSAKQEVVAQAFELAASRLKQLPDHEYVALLATLAVKAAHSGHEQIVLSPADRERYGQQVVAAANQKLAQGSLSLSQATRPIQGGLLLTEGDIEINCSFESLLRLLQGEISSDVAKILFD